MGGSGSVSWLIRLRTMHDEPTQLMHGELTVSQGSCLGQYITVQCHSALLAHAHPTMFYIPLVYTINCPSVFAHLELYCKVLMNRHAGDAILP